MNYAKLIGGELEFAPRKLKEGEAVVYNPSGELLKAHGYKPLLLTDPPEAEDGYVPFQHWVETETVIVQSWSLEPEGELSDAEALDILLGGEAV